MPFPFPEHQALPKGLQRDTLIIKIVLSIESLPLSRDDCHIALLDILQNILKMNNTQFCLHVQLDKSSIKDKTAANLPINKTILSYVLMTNNYSYGLWVMYREQTDWISVFLLQIDCNHIVRANLTKESEYGAF